MLRPTDAKAIESVTDHGCGSVPSAAYSEGSLRTGSARSSAIRRGTPYLSRRILTESGVEAAMAGRLAAAIARQAARTSPLFFMGVAFAAARADSCLGGDQSARAGCSPSSYPALRPRLNAERRYGP